MTLEMSTFVSICLLVPVITNSVGGISMRLVTQLSAGVKKPDNSYFNDEHCILITMPFGTCVVFLSMNSCQDLYVNIEGSARMMHIFL
ncbi:unnamed protein product [Sphagnum jensenii]|uniref:Uncharacterized protein n=1 Tax=Sphagnum jensenii TaxID=128206 RepID=A0ABP1BK48_9BRYO